MERDPRPRPETDQAKWDERHANTLGARPPSLFLHDWAHFLRGRVLEVAAGSGRNSLFLGRRGLRVDAIDVSFTALERLHQQAAAEHLGIQCLQADLTCYPLPPRVYDAVVNIRYLQRSLFEPIRQALRPNGIVVFETFLIDQRALGHPKNPEFLLAHGELRAAFAGFEILHYSEGLEKTEGDPAHLARLVARKV